MRATASSSPAHAGDQRDRPRAQRVLDAGRQDHIGVVGRHAAAADRAAQLQREKRIALAHVDDAPEQHAGRKHRQPRGQQPPKRVGVKSSDLETLGRQHELERRRRPRAPGEEKGHGLIAQPARGKGQRGHRQRIEPRQVVDSHHQWLVGGQPAQDVQERQGDGVRAGSRASQRLGAQQRHLERRPLRRGQAGQGLGPDPVAQIDQTGEGHPGLRPGRTGGQHEPARGSGHFQAGFPQRRLPDPRGAGQQQRSGTAVGGHQTAQRRQLRIASEDFRRRLEHDLAYVYPGTRGPRGVVTAVP